MAERNEELIATPAVAKMMGCKPHTIEVARLKGSGIPYLKIGRMVRYRVCDVQDFLQKCVRNSTSDTGAGR